MSTETSTIAIAPDAPATRADNSLLSRWWWTIDRWTLAALLLLAPMTPVRRALRGAVQALPQRISGTLGARGPPALRAA